MLILVVDDNRLNREIETRILVNMGYDVITAESGLEALRLFNEKKPCAILLDCIMPEMSGYEVAEKIRQIESVNDLVRTPVIAVTGDDIDDNRELCIKAGMDDFISKPVDILKLDMVLRKHIEIKRGKMQPLNIKALMISADDDSEWAKELFALFVSDTDTRVKEIERSIKKGPDTELLTRNFHTIKSSAGSVGADIVAEFAKKLEVLSRDSDFNAVSEKMREFKEEIQKVINFVKSGCQGLNDEKV